MNLQRCHKNNECKRSVSSLVLILLLAVSGVISSTAFGENTHHENITYLKLKYLNPNARLVSRGPDNFVPDDDVEPLPLEVHLWVKDILIEDDAGVLREVKNNIKTWQYNEEYARKWNLTSTGLYLTPTQKEQAGYLKGIVLKYIDKRLAGEIKNAKEGSTLQRIGQVEKALQPKAEAQISANFKVKMNAKVLEQKIIIFLENPYIDYETNVDNHGQVKMRFAKKFDAAQLESEIRYDVSGEVWVAQLDRPINPNLRARLTSTQSDSTMFFTEKSDNKLELIFNKSF